MVAPALIPDSWLYNEMRTAERSKPLPFGLEPFLHVPATAVLVDRFGGRQCALYAALSSIADRLRLDDAVDIYSTARLLNMQRPNMLTRFVRVAGAVFLMILHSLIIIFSPLVIIIFVSVLLQILHVLYMFSLN